MLYQPLSTWKKNKMLCKVSWIVILALLANLIGPGLVPPSDSNGLIGISTAQAAVSDRDGLGLESFWSFFENDLGCGYSYSVNTHTGNLVIQGEIVLIDGRGNGLVDGLVYNSLSSQTDVLSAGWKLANDLFIQENADYSVTLKDRNGTNHRFTRNPDLTYTSPDGIYLTLTKVDATTFTVKNRAGSVYRFQNGLFASITDLNGNVT